MSTRSSFRSLFMVASCAGAALGCYLVSLRVASERASLEDVETQIVLEQRDLRVLQTEIGTRGRMAQLERWNASALALSAPAADQFLRGGFELARLAQPQHKVDFEVPVVLAAAPQPIPAKPPIGEAASDDSGASAGLSAGALIHTASLKTETREVPVKPAAMLPQAAGPQSSDRPVTAAKPANKSSLDMPGLAAAKSRSAKAVPTPAKKMVDKPVVAAAKAVTKPQRLAKNDPLAPLPGKRSAKNRQDVATEQ